MPPMGSGLYIKVLSSWEVIVASLALMFLLPLVFYVASTRARPRRSTALRRAASKPAKRAESTKRPADAGEAEE